MKKIGIDFDDTLMPTRHAIAALLNRKHGTALDADGFEPYFVTEHWGYDHQQFDALFNENVDAVHSLPPFPNVIETLAAWNGKAALVLITARPEDWRGSALSWLARHRIVIDQMFCAPGNPSKAQRAAEEGVELFIEDHPKHALELAEKGITVLLLDRPYNQACAHQAITRVKDWGDIDRIVRPQLEPAGTAFATTLDSSGSRRP